MANSNENVNFKVSSALKDLIGKDLIRNDNVAIFELVKNSYDAYARKVQITLEDNKIIIADNGKGMTFDDLKNKWLFLAYSAKKDGTEYSEEDKQSSYRDLINRHFAGSKGVGRFSCDRLGNILVLTTKNAKSKYVEKIFVDWNDFEKNQEKVFESIELHHESIEELPSFPDSSTTGTILEISKVREKWDRSKILNLKSSLEKLINPFSETTDFEIEIICEREKIADERTKEVNGFLEKDIVNGIIKNSIANVISLKTTKIEVKLDSQSIKTVLTDRDEKIYVLEEENTYSKLSDVTINLYYLNSAAKTAFSKRMGVQPVQYGSIFLFRNGFRILPFGDKDDDSWKLNSRAQQGYNRFLGTRDLFGRVDIRTNNVDDFKESTSRDGGLIESEMTIQLFRLFDIVHKRLERYVSGVLWGETFLKKDYFKNISDVEKNRSILKNDKDADSAKYVINNSLGSKIDFVYLVKTLINDKSVNVLYYNKSLANIFSQPTLVDDANPQVFDDLERIAEKTKDSVLLYTIEETKKKIKELEQQRRAEEERAANAEARAINADNERDTAIYEKKIAEVKMEEAERKSLFLLSDVNSDVKKLAALQHTITHTSNKISKKLKEAMDFVQTGDKEELISTLNQIYILNQKVLTVSGLVSKVNYNTNASKIKADLISFIDDYINNICSESFSELEFDILPTDLKWETKFESIKVVIIIDNLISNAIKANAKKITIKWEHSNDSYVLTFKDDGFGIPKENQKKIFEYRYTTTNGGGLGLFHIRTIMQEDFRGDVRFVEDSVVSGAEFKLIFKESKDEFKI